MVLVKMWEIFVILLIVFIVSWEVLLKLNYLSYRMKVLSVVRLRLDQGSFMILLLLYLLICGLRMIVFVKVV